jgi:hypothetical protein
MSTFQQAGTRIQRALRLLGVIDPNEPVEPEDMQNGLLALNAMLRRWEANGLAVGYTPISTGSATLTVPDEALEVIDYQLAIRLAPEYDTEPSPTVAATATQLLAELKRDRMVEMPMTQTLDTPHGFRTGKYDTLTDTWRR